MSGHLAAAHLHAGLVAAAMGGEKAGDPMALFGFTSPAPAGTDIAGLKKRRPHWFAADGTLAGTPAPPALA